MMQMQLVLDKKSDSLLYVRLSIGYRVVFFIISLALVLGMVSLETYSWLALLVLGICLFALLYNERWIFDTGEGYVEHHFGLIFLYKKSRFDLADVVAVEVEKIDRGKPMNKSMVSGSVTGRGEREEKREDGTAEDSGSTPGIALPRKRSFLSPAFFTRLILILKSDKPKSLETIKTRDPRDLVHKGEALADFLDLPFYNRY
jgi:hypothetical protein